MKGKILIQILEFLEQGVSSNAHLIEAILVSGYGASINKIDYEYEKLQRASKMKRLKADDIFSKKLRLQKFLSKLKKDGLIENVKNDKSKFAISKIGKTKLQKLKSTLPSKTYESDKGDHSPIIISFDIPEKFKKKRNWLREVIQNLGFEMVHKSVWLGKTKIPKQLIFDLQEMNILEFVEIFEVSKSGTLQKLGK